MPGRLIATCLALTAFTVAIVMGMAAGNPAESILGRALMAMFACFAIGSLIGHVAERIVSDHIEQYQRNNPLPSMEMEAHTEAAAETAASIPQDASDGDRSNPQARSRAA